MRVGIIWRGNGHNTNPPWKDSGTVNSQIWSLPQASAGEGMTFSGNAGVNALFARSAVWEGGRSFITGWV